MDKKSNLKLNGVGENLDDKGFVIHGEKSGARLNDLSTGQDTKVKKAFERHADDEKPRPVDKRLDNQELDDFDTASNWNSDWQQ